MVNYKHGLAGMPAAQEFIGC